MIAKLSELNFCKHGVQVEKVGVISLKKVADWLSFGINSQDFDNCMEKKVIENQDLPHLAASRR